MPSLKDIRKRISSVKNTQKITRAMKLVAAAKLRRAQEAIVAARPYADGLKTVVGELAERAGEDAHPLLGRRGPGGGAETETAASSPAARKAEILLLTSDRGLAGSFNTQAIRAVERFVENELAECTDISLRIVGRKGNEYFKRRNANIRGVTNVPEWSAALPEARELANRVIGDFVDGHVSEVYAVYNEFKSAMTQNVVVSKILPVEPETGPSVVDVPADFLYEPSKKELLEHLLPLHVQVCIFRYLLESIASEFGSRMSAMDSATRNAGEMIDKLTLQYNRARQASITKELLEIISGSEALKG